MKVAIFTPAYREQVHVRTAYTLGREVAWVLSRGGDAHPFYVAGCSVDRARNYAVKQALAQGFDLLLMIDADVYVPDPRPALDVLGGALDLGAGAAGAIVIGRDGRPNTGPNPGEVGTGLMLINLRAIAGIAGPWFKTELGPDGTTIECGEDLYFCRLLRRHGLDVRVVANLETAHVGERYLVSRGE